MNQEPKEYEIAAAYLQRYAREIEEKQPVPVEIRDHSSLEMLRVQAIISESPDDLPGSFRLWVRDIHELLSPELRAIQILEVLDEDEVRMSSVPRHKWDYYSGRETE